MTKPASPSRIDPPAAAAAGTVIAVCVGAGGIPNHPRPRAFLGREGLAGDTVAHPRRHGGPEQAVCLFSVENYRRLEALGLPRLSPGALAENLTLQGLDLQALEVGDVLAVGGAVIQISRVRTPCRTLDAIDPRLKDLLMPLSVAGRVERVAREGGSRLVDALLPGQVADALARRVPPPRAPRDHGSARGPGSLGPGWKARVLEEGEVAPGDAVRLLARGPAA